MAFLFSVIGVTPEDLSMKSPTASLVSLRDRTCQPLTASMKEKITTVGGNYTAFRPWIEGGTCTSGKLNLISMKRANFVLFNYPESDKKRF